jgi:malonyl-CoA O-methyltransferase
VTALAPREAYRLWAPVYEGETAISALEAATVAELGLATMGRALLDAGCGTARRMRDNGFAACVGVDLSIDMLRQAPASSSVAAGDLRALPFASESFDVVWCRLAIGHVPELDAAYHEMARVCRAGGDVVVSDVSPDAATAGHRRTFRDADGAAHDVEHAVHTLAAHEHAASAAGLELTAHREGRVGPRIRSFYAEADRLSAYDAQLGSAIVIVLSWRKRAANA